MTDPVATPAPAGIPVATLFPGLVWVLPIVLVGVFLVEVLGALGS